MNRRTYRPSAAARYRRRGSPYRRSYGGGQQEGGLRLGGILLWGLLILAVYLRFSPGETPQAVRQTVSSLLNGDMDLKEAVTVFGRKAAGGEEDGALLVFGRKLLGQDGEQQPEPKAEDYQTPVEQQIHQIAPEQMTWNQAVGNQSDRLFLSEQGLAGLCESPYPAFDVSHLRFDLPEEELLDDTPNEAFSIPSPDVVDDTVYQLAFPCAAPLTGRPI